MDFEYIYNRAKGMILNPVQEWESVKSEHLNRNEIIKNYALPLILMGGVAIFLGQYIDPSYLDPSFDHVLMLVFVSIIVAIAGIFINANVINYLAPNFNTEKNLENAFKLVIYASTPSYVGSIIASLHTSLSIFGLLGLYSVYLYWLGYSQIMGTPNDKRSSYLIVSFLLIIGIYFILALFTGSLFLSSTVL